MQQYPPPNLPPRQPYPPPQAAPPAYPQRQVAPPRRKKSAVGRWLWITVGAFSLGMLLLVGVLMLGVVLLYASGNVLPGVSAAGVKLGMDSEPEATQKIATSWNNNGILLRDEQRTWAINPAELGLAIDAPATAKAARDWGRREGGASGALRALVSGVDVAPHLLVDLNQARTRLEEVRPIVEVPPKNAGVQLVNGQAQAVPPVQGRILDVNATLIGLQNNAAAELADGALDLVMVPVAPAVTDSTPLLAQAQALLSQPLTIDIYDPVSDTAQPVSLSPAEWGQWLVAAPDPASPIGLALSLDATGLGNFLQQQSSALGSPRYLNIEESLARVNQALAANQLNAWVRVYHTPTTYTVQSGDSIASIGQQVGIPYPWIQAANPGVSALSPGQQIVLPSRDDLLPLPIVRHKRIVISISSQEMWAYENGNLVYNWRVSTGIARSPTSSGVFQIQSHELNAYASQWNLYMPHFMGVYQPGPGADVMNGFHGFPTDANGGYLLWENSLGRPATYGCILLNLQNAQTLYSWADEGVVVEIRA